MDLTSARKRKAFSPNVLYSQRFFLDSCQIINWGASLDIIHSGTTRRGALSWRQTARSHDPSHLISPLPPIIFFVRVSSLSDRSESLDGLATCLVIAPICTLFRRWNPTKTKYTGPTLTDLEDAQISLHVFVTLAIELPNSTHDTPTNWELWMIRSLLPHLLTASTCRSPR